MQYCIDYRNGGMGNTILAHVLYAADQIDFQVHSFFSAKGDAHRISKFNKTNLVAHHLIEHPDPNLVCVLQIVCHGWDEILRTKMSYCKWHKTVPSLTNYVEFFQSGYALDRLALWQEFYHNIKDSNWPECATPEDRYELSIDIRQEIDQFWTDPESTITSGYQMIEFLTVCYYDILSNPSRANFQCPVYRTGAYLRGEFDILENLCAQLGWNWDESKSEIFYRAMIAANKQYMVWWDNFKQQYIHSIQTGNLNWNFDNWEMSLMLAKILADHGQDPRSLRWQSLACFFDNKSLKLNQLFDSLS